MRYQVFGGCLDSALAFPSLPPAIETVPTSWRLLLRNAPAPDVATSELRSVQLSDDLAVRIATAGRRLRVSFTDTGDYELSADTRTITWYRSPDADLTNARIDVLGTLLTLALHLRGQLTLHGSAVATEDGVIAFLAPSGYGKSTLAMSLTLAGARFMSDDAVPVRVLGTEVIASPGVPSPRFREDAFARFVRDLPAASTDSNGKVSLGDRLDDDVVEARERPLAGLYVLNPVIREIAASPSRAPVAPTMATIALMQNAKLAKLLWAEESARLLTMVAEVACRAPVWRLDVPRDLDLLPAVAEQLLDWHGSAARGVTSRP